MEIWDSFGKALGADPRELCVIQGVSGIEHSVQAIHVDDATKRVIIISAEPNPRIAAMMRIDIQATMPDVSVIIARPITFDIGAIARNFLSGIEIDDIDVSDINVIFSNFNKQTDEQKLSTIKFVGGSYLESTIKTFNSLNIPTLDHVFSIVQQGAFIDWNNIIKAFGAGSDGKISISYIKNIDTMAMDRKYGICPIPLYELKEDDWNLLQKGNDIIEVQSLLKRLNIYQYFFPSPDQTALAIIDNGVKNSSQIIQHIERLPELGHPLDANELINPSSISALLDELKNAGYIAEGELGCEISESGTTARSIVRYRPRESLFSKLFNAVKFNINFNIHDYMK